MSAIFCGSFIARASDHALVLQTDFGLKDGAVAAMRGVAVGVSPRIMLFDLSHENTPYDIWEAAYRLKRAGSAALPALETAAKTDGAISRRAQEVLSFLKGPGAEAANRSDAIPDSPTVPGPRIAVSGAVCFIKEWNIRKSLPYAFAS